MRLNTVKQWFPATQWVSQYNGTHFSQDIVAAVIVTVLLIPQSLAYALLAGVPPEVGLYASIFPLVAYALFGTSRTLSVGPVAVISLMTATSLGGVAELGIASYLTAAITLAFLSGVFLLIMGVLKFGFITNFLSHSVISGFISASGIIIALSQLKHILAIDLHGDTLRELVPSFLDNINKTHFTTLLLGVSIIAFLLLSKHYANKLFCLLGVNAKLAETLGKTAPILGVFASILVVYYLHLEDHNVAITGNVPAGLPSLAFTLPPMALIEVLAIPALLISLIGYIESVSVGKILGSKRREKINPNQELIALGAANIASSLSGAFPVTGGFSRSVVNFDAGAATQAASIYAAVGIALASLFLTPILYYLPKAALAATIIVAVISLIDFSILKETWRFAKSDFIAVLTTILLTLIYGVEVGVTSGIFASIALHLYRTSKPHVAEVGLIEGTQHFRNIHRYETLTVPHIITFRPDESLFFVNTNHLERLILEAVSDRKEITDVILLCNAVNEIDFSAIGMLKELNSQLLDQGIKLHFSEVKGPVMDALSRCDLLEKLSGNVYLTQYEAFNAIKSLSK
ncbi:MAG: sodium-independent anion transporter [Gammaproteobacteria bacterium]|nr:sulfate permease [Gammaproteobacteria bacterium]PCH63798.1 MAG: sodium-independent anion transporter [Gammaproteobacteria bacterium]